ncbi:MAG: NHLP family bacteriocin export ABC transporter permease/ATPase subunit, partial [Lachnospiraceae bacterium]|nr:NHLP family bacteriocin export ABC transporter permease/ATPase subunit [Lachnospiraceae bacterium]
MSWFDEQIHHRDRSDQEVMEDSLLHIASAVLGRGKARSLQNRQTAAQDALEEILDYYHIKSDGIPEDVTELEDQLEQCMQPHGLMWRRVELEGKWYRDSMGPILGFRKDNDNTVALLPGPLFGYYYRDPETGLTHRVNKSNASQFAEEGLCFYAPLPLKKLDIRDLLLYLKDSLNTEDFALFFGLSLVVTLLGMLMTNITRALTGFVLESGDVPLLMGTAVFMISTIFASVLINTSRQMMMSRIGIKASLSMDAAMMMRIMQMPPGFFRQYSSGELSTRYNAIGQICNLILGNIFSTGLGALLSMLYITQIFFYAPALAGMSLLIIAAGVAISFVSGMIQMRVSRELMERSSKESGLSFSLITGIQKIRLSGAEKRAFAKWGHAYADVAALSYNPPMLTRVGASISIAINLVGTIALFFLAVENKVTPSEYIAFNTAYGAVSASFGALTGAALSTAGVRPILEVARPILETEPEASQRRALVSELSGNIELNGVYFRYDPSMPWVIKGLNLKIRQGDYVAIVG